MALDAVIQHVQRQIERCQAEMAEMLAEQQRLRILADRQRASLKDPAVELADVQAISHWLLSGSRLARELDKFKEKDLTLERRISDCRASLVKLRRKMKLLTTIQSRNLLLDKKQRERRLERERMMQSIAARVEREDIDRWRG